MSPHQRNNRQEEKVAKSFLYVGMQRTNALVKPVSIPNLLCSVGPRYLKSFSRNTLKF